jgi:thermostable 8-oxoguanine DNA glycosylase
LTLKSYKESFTEEVLFCIIDLQLSFDEVMAMPRSWRRVLVEKKVELNRKELEKLKEVKARSRTVRRVRI